MTTYPKRLIEVDLPIKRISAHAPACAGRRREKSIRHGAQPTRRRWRKSQPVVVQQQQLGLFGVGAR
jgi:hypothetical protein